MYKPVLLIDKNEIKKSGLTDEQISEGMDAAGKDWEEWLKEHGIAYDIIETRPGVTDEQLKRYGEADIMADKQLAVFVRLFEKRSWKPDEQ